MAISTSVSVALQTMAKIQYLRLGSGKKSVPHGTGLLALCLFLYFVWFTDWLGL